MLRKLDPQVNRAGVVAKPSPLGDERGEFGGRLGYGTAGGKPAFQRAIPHGTVIVDPLLQVVIFEVSGGFLRGGSPGSLLGPLRRVAESILRAHSGCEFEPSAI